ncbi:AarF/ABC1/UbiB kinase family protein [Methanolobus sp. ZRKC3]|uniref:ABC1 kinase family protein n=1 Tax=Methanolobus sp. ZRKC3 TaxID=3125786 RepID=UPI003248022D
MRGRKIHRYSMIKRYGKIIDTLIKYEFGHIVDRLGVRRFRPLRSRIKKDRVLEERTSDSKRVRMVLEELGPTYIKLGQIMSMRQDLIPPEYAREFSKLQDDVQPFEFEDVRRLIKEELDADIETLFMSFDEVPIAAASIGQVHRARLNTGEEVVVKVQRPGIRKIIDADMDIMYSVAGFAEEHLPEARLYRLSEIVEEFERSIHAEMEYTQEGRNAEHFAHNFSDDPNIYIPKVYWDLTSTKVLTLEYIDGIKSNLFDEVDRLGVDRAHIATVVTEAFMKQVYEDGFFHADLHPGNVFIMKDGKIALLDFGMAGFLSSDLKKLLIDELIAVIKGDTVLYIELLRDLGSIDESVDMQSLKIDIDHLLYKYYGRSLKQLNTASILEEMIGMLRKHQVRVPSNVALLSKGVMTVEGFGGMMDPGINMTTIAEPFARRAIDNRLKFRNIADGTYKDLNSWLRLAHRVPTKISHILDIAERGYLKLRFDDHGFDRIVAELDAASNRLAFSLIISSIIVGSSIVIQTGMEPHIWGVPMLGVGGFLVAGLFGMWLVVYILRTGRI